MLYLSINSHRSREKVFKLIEPRKSNVFLKETRKKNKFGFYEIDSHFEHYYEISEDEHEKIKNIKSIKLIKISEEQLEKSFTSF